MARRRKKRSSTDSSVAARLGGESSAVKPALEPLRCPKCSAPVPLGSGDVATCSFCSEQVPLPEPYRQLRDAERARTTDRAQAEALYRKLGKPSHALDLWVSLMSISSGAVLMLAYVLMSISAVLMLLAGFALELFLHFGAPVLGIDLIDRFGGGTVYLGFAIGVVVFVLLPIWLKGYLDTAGEIRKALQANLAAHAPQRPGWASTCRSCGAALDVAPGALGVRCAYCQTDNLVAIPAAVVKAAGVRQDNFHRSIVDAADRARALRAEARAGLPGAVKYCAIGVAVFGLVGKGCTSLDEDRSDLPTWSDSMGPPRILAKSFDGKQGWPMNTVFNLACNDYLIALHRHEVFEVDDDTEAEPATITNMTTFPFLTRSWDMDSKPRPGGGYRGRWRAPYAGLFEIKFNGMDNGHLRWRIAN